MRSVSEKIRIGVIGAGWFASRRHLPALVNSPDAELVALCRRDRAMLQKVAEHFGVKQTFADYREMLDSTELDAVLIATPHAMHYEQARECLNRGLHVLIEKPIALTRAEAHQINALADQKERVVLVAMNPPYWAHGHYLRDTIRDGKIGNIESISVNWTGDVRHVFGKKPLPAEMPGVVPPTLFRADPHIAGGGHLFDTGCHLICEAL